MAAANNKPVNFPDMINKIQMKLDSFGPGPHSDQQKEEIKNLQMILSKAQQENMKYMAKYSKGHREQHHDKYHDVPIDEQTPLSSTSQAQYQPIPQPVSVKPAVDAVKMEASATPPTHKILDRKRLQDLVKEIDPMAQLEDDVEEVLMQIADDFIENVVNSSCDIAKHRHSDTLEVKDVQLYLDRAWNMWIPGFGTEEIRPYKRAPATEAHRQRLALIKKTLKKS